MSQQSAINSTPADFAWTPPDDRLRYATRAWLMWLQGVFRYSPPGRYRWNESFDETEIVITDQDPDASPRTNKRPIITTSRGAATWVGTSLGQTESLGLDTPDFIFSDMLQTSLTITVIAREGLEAQDIAYTIFRLIPVFKKQLLRSARMHSIGNNITITAESGSNIVPGSSTPEWRMVQIIVPIWIQDRISSESVGFHTLLRAVSIHMQDGPTITP